MYTPFEEQLIGELSVVKDCYNQVCKELVEEQEENEKLEARLKTLVDFIEEFTQHINRSIMAENHILSVKVREINDLLNDLYEGIDENYTESLERNDKLSMNCAKSELDLITKILKEVEKI
ncbi:MAG: hypothetical protein ACI39B_08015 [Methanobrevibacter smithii]|mgnify:CR=1 FL=1|jgi:predicted nuclease with TOPRIM domain|nr:MAG TPA: hypothetical protein [Caudoviricetes sp.]